MAPFFGLPDLGKLLRHIRSNALTVNDMDTISNEYLKDIGAQADLQEKDEHSHPFCVLYKIGMLGHIQPEFEKELTSRQRFVKPRNLVIKNSIGLPPTENYYLIHPALDNMIVGASGRRYLQRSHSGNIIGNDLAWDEEIASFFVLKGDVCGFSQVMNSEYYSVISSKIYDWARSSCSDLTFFEISGGDSVLFIDRSAERIIRSALDFLKRAKKYKEKIIFLRFGGAAGPIIFQKTGRRYEDRWDDVTYPLGLALRTSARIEPYAPRGSIIVEDNFINMAKDIVISFRVRKMFKEEIPFLHFDEAVQKFVVQKNKDDPPYLTDLWEISSIDEKQYHRG